VKALSLAVFAVLALSLSSFAAEKKADHKMAAHKSEGGGPDVAYMQKIMDAWDTLKTENVAGYYQQGPDHLFCVELVIMPRESRTAPNGGTARVLLFLSRHSS